MLWGHGDTKAWRWRWGLLPTAVGLRPLLASQPGAREPDLTFLNPDTLRNRSSSGAPPARPPPPPPPSTCIDPILQHGGGGCGGAQQPRAAKKGVIPLPKRCNPPRKGTAPPPPFQPPMHPHPNAITPSRCSSPNPSLPCILILMQPPPAPPPPGRSSAKRGPTGSRCQGGSQAGWAARGGPLSALMGSWAEGGGAASPPAPY